MILKTIEIIKNELKSLDGKYDVVIFGSYIEGGYSPEYSDIDIAVITRKPMKDQKALFKILFSVAGQFPDVYDIKLFELLPITIQMSIINNNQVLFGNAIDLSEYFYYFRKIWNDVSYRISQNQFENAEDELNCIRNGKKLGIYN